MTLPEPLLWKALRKPDCGFRRQAPIGPYIADFAHHGARFIVELDGPWHDFPESQLHDAERDEWFVANGYRVLRFRNEQVFDDLDGLIKAIRTLLPRGEKGRVEGDRTTFPEKTRAAPPEILHQHRAPTLTQPSPLEGEGSEGSGCP